VSKAASDLATFRETRKRYLGGTDIAAILGVSQWASPLSVYLDKTGVPSDDQDSLQMRRGLYLEQFIADEFERVHPEFTTWKARPPVRTDWGFPAGASIDRMIALREKPRTPVAILETKTAFRFGWRDWDEANADLPDAYYVQVQHYLAVTGLPLAYGAADVGDDKLRIIEIPENKAVQKRLIEAGRDFWQQHVEKDIPPEPIGTDADRDALNRMYPNTIPDPPVYIEGDDARILLSDYLAHKFKAEEAKREAEKAKQGLQALMGEHESAVVGHYRLTWKKQTKTLIDSQRLKGERPEIAAEYSKQSESRSFGQPKEFDSEGVIVD
jgi:putative phage-type endonuclease